jgi:Lar family restriction alleviation protein
MKATTKLKPCPFCGSDYVVIDKCTKIGVGARYRVICQECMATVDNGCAQNAKQAAKAWNRRESGKAAGR